MEARRPLLSAALLVSVMTMLLPGVDAGARGTGDPGDASPPEISITTPAEGQHVTVGQDVLPQYGCRDTDGDSHMTGCSAPAKADTSSPGCHTLTVTATASD